MLHYLDIFGADAVDVNIVSVFSVERKRERGGERFSRRKIERNDMPLTFAFVFAFQKFK